MNIKFFKCSAVSLITVLLLICTNNVYSATNEDFLKVKIQYSENPNNPDFFALGNSTNVLLGDLGLLKGFWHGSYDLNINSIVWINSNLNKKKIFSKVDFDNYELSLGFEFLDGYGDKNIVIAQKDIEYGPVNYELLEGKQINYWAKANNNNWLEVIRGKLYMVSEDKLFTAFQTTVYESGIPIYAFKGETILKRDGL